MKMENKAEKQVERAVASSDGAGSAERADGASAEPLETHRLTAEEIEELKEDAAKAREHWEQLLRTSADFENFKKRTARERQDLARYANESLLQKLIPILDSLDMALAAASAQPATVEALQTGVAMIHQQLKTALADAGLEEIDATNKTFDPNWHEALSQQETDDVDEGQVVQQLRKGYRLRDRLLRPAGVVVAKKPAEK
jgi:molecular chaperone GrpE